MKNQTGDFLRFMRISAVALAAAGCAQDETADLKPASREVEWARTPIVVDFIAAEPERWKRLARFLRSGIIAQLARSETFSPRTSNVTDGMGVVPLRLTGELTNVEEGNLEGRVLIGWGVGAIVMTGRFQIVDADGRTLVIFDKRRQEDGDGWDEVKEPITWEQVAEDFGRETAKSIIDWQERRDSQF